MGYYNKLKKKKQYNDHLLTKSFLYGGHLTLGDLALFAYLYSVMVWFDFIKRCFFSFRLKVHFEWFL